MLFNTLNFVFIFLPITFVVYFGLNKVKLIQLSKSWLVLASLIFYGYWDVKYLALILLSMFFNYSIGKTLNNPDNINLKINRKAVLFIGISANLLLLMYYKYLNFFISNINHLLKNDLQMLNIILPLGISFFTFTQIAYLVDAYKMKVKELDLLNYALFVTFFPHLIAGPILHHSEMMPQFDNLRTKIFNYKNLTAGLVLFSIGLFKKMALADSLAIWANNGFDVAPQLSIFEAWFSSLSYTFQLYFDFSGYTDMALGIALMFNIKLPINFNSPYKAVDIQDFWRRWHITLSRFLRDYIYIPLGGNRKGELATYSNLMTTFLIGGIWHGASWTFLFWGFLHGIALVFLKLWQKLNIKMNSFLAWFITFNYVNVCWIFFRAKNWHDATKMLKGMCGFSGVMLPRFSHEIISFKNSTSGLNWNLNFLILLVVSFIFISLKNSNQIADRFKPSLEYSISFGFLLFICIHLIFAVKVTPEFLYFNF